MAFGGEVRPDDDTPDVFVLKEDKDDLFERVYLPQVLVTDTVKAYEQDSKGDYTHTFVLDPATQDNKGWNGHPCLSTIPILARRSDGCKTSLCPSRMTKGTAWSTFSR